MGDVVVRETFVEAVTRLLDGRKLPWLAAKTSPEISYDRLQRLMNLKDTRRNPQPTLEEAVIIARVFDVSLADVLGFVEADDVVGDDGGAA